MTPQLRSDLRRFVFLISLILTTSTLTANADETVLPGIVNSTEAEARSLPVQPVNLKIDPVLKTPLIDSKQPIKLIPQQSPVGHSNNSYGFGRNKSIEQKSRHVDSPGGKNLTPEDFNRLNVLYSNGDVIYGGGPPNQNYEAPKPRYYSPNEVGDFDAPKIRPDTIPDTIKEHEPIFVVPPSAWGHSAWGHLLEK